MRLTKLRLSNFQSFGPEETEISLEDISYVIGPNGAGKTALLEALARMFSPVPSLRKVQLSDFHVPINKTATEVHGSEPTLWIEAQIEFPEANKDDYHATIPAHFAHMRIDEADQVPHIVVRLTADLAPDGVIDEKLEYVLLKDEDGAPTSTAAMNRYDRASIEVHYLPARRDPGEIISYTTSSLLGRMLRATSWDAEKETLLDLSKQLSTSLGGNSAVTDITEQLSAQWGELHKGEFFKDPAVSFGANNLESVLKQISISFSPSHDGSALPFERLSDGQKSLLYISLVLAWQSVSRKTLNGEISSFDIQKLNPPVFTILAVEEPENSLSPHYLGKIMEQIKGELGSEDMQALVATHSPAILRRVPPEKICFLRLDSSRTTAVRKLVLPKGETADAKFINEAVLSFPELYFSRLVILGEGDSENVVLRKLLSASGMGEDAVSVSVVPLGGRHVNHFWRLLDSLEIPYVTLLDLDSGRHGGGWGRISNAYKQLNKIQPKTISEDLIEKIPKWDNPKSFPEYAAEDDNHLHFLEDANVFFSAPLDLDLMMLEAFPEEYEASSSNDYEEKIKSVLGESRANATLYKPEQLRLFNAYHTKFKLSSKPSTHLLALSKISDETLSAEAPAVLRRMVKRIHELLEENPE